MNIRIRRGVFETNSSSVHALVFHPTKEYINENYMVIRGGEYGRYPLRPLKDLEDRLNYLWTAVCETYHDYFHLPNGNYDYIYYEEKMKWWENEIHMCCPNVKLVRLNEKDWYYIDHVDCLESLLTEMENNPELIRFFLLDSNALIYVYSDEFSLSDFDYEEDMPSISWNEYETLIKDDDTYVYVKGN